MWLKENLDMRIKFPPHTHVNAILYLHVENILSKACLSRAHYALRARETNHIVAYYVNADTINDHVIYIVLTSSRTRNFLLKIN